MTARDWIIIIASVVSSGGISAVVVALVNWRHLGPKAKAETAKINAEAQSIEDQDEIRWRQEMRAEIKRLTERVEALEHKNDALERKNDQLDRLTAAMRYGLSTAAAWMQRVREVLTPEQQIIVGPPPDVNHLITPAKE